MDADLLETLPMEASLSEDQLLELDRLQTELVNLQTEMASDGRRLVVLFEGRDTAGKGGAIYRFMRYLDPRRARVVALPRPTERQQGQWFFQRYLEHLPTSGEIVLFDRSWYNRAVVEPVLGFCTPDAYQRFLRQVVHLEEMLIDEGITLIKLWFSITRETQAKRLAQRRHDPRKIWKLSAVDRVAQERWDAFTEHKERMFALTSTSHAPWTVVLGEDKYLARTEAMRYLLQRMGVRAEGLRLEPDPRIIRLPTA